MNEKTALNVAVNLLSKRDYGSGELGEKLRRSGFPAEEIQLAVKKLAERGYLNDTALCLSLFEKLYYTQKYSANFVAYKLRGRGFGENDILLALEAVAVSEMEVRIAQKLLFKKFKSEEILPNQLVKFLLNKGFSYSTIEKVKSQVNTEFSGEDTEGL